MDAPPLSMSKSSNERTFDETVVRMPLLFRLHSHKSSWTSFYPKEMVIVASLHGLKDSNSEELSRRLKDLVEKTPTPLTSEETGEAAEKHITSWLKNNNDPSNFISLTSNIQYVFWEWKRRMSNWPPSERLEDDFVVIVFKGPELRASGRAKLGTEWLQIEKHKEAYNFARSHEEVIVARYIDSEAILGSTSMSKLEDFIPSWYKKQRLEHARETGFQKFLPPVVDEVDYARAHEALRFSLALLAPMLVLGERHSADIGSAVGGGDIEHSRAEGMSPKVEPRSGLETVLGLKAAEDDGIVASESYKKRSHSSSPKVESRLASTTEDSPKREPSAKRKRLSEEEQPQAPCGLENEYAVGTADAETQGDLRDDQASVEPLERWSKYIGILATEVCRVNEKGRKECQKLCTFHGRELLKQYRTAMQRDLGNDPHKTMQKIMDEYKDWPWDKGTSKLSARDRTQEM